MTAPVLLPSSRRRPSPAPGDSSSAAESQAQDWAQSEGRGQERGQERGMARPGARSGAAPMAHPSGAGRWLARLHWTSGDAVLVVLAYAWALSRGAETPLPWSVYAFLSLGIWMGYTADRLADLERNPSRARQTGRHAFHLQHRRVLTTLWGGGFLVAWPLAWVVLPSPAVVAGGGLAAAAALYVWWGSAASASGASRPSGGGNRKRRCTAILLTGAGAWSLWTGGGGFGAPVGVLAGIFAVAAWWNLTLLGYHRGSPPRELEGGFGRGVEGGGLRRLEEARVRGRLRELPRGSILAAVLLLALPLWSGLLPLLPGAIVLVLGLGGLAWRGDGLHDDALGLAADGTLCLGFLALGAGVGLGVG